MKWFKVLLGVTILAAVMTVPTGCGKGKITELKPAADTGVPLPGHEAAAKEEMEKGKKAAGVQ